MEAKDILITGIQPWDISIGSNCKEIALEFSKKNRVLYVNPPLDSSTYYKANRNNRIKKTVQVIRKEKPSIEKISDSLWVFTPPVILTSINWLPTPLFRILNKINGKKFFNAIAQALHELQFSKPILFTDSDMFRSFHLKEFLQPELFIYYSRDNLMTVPYWKKHGQFLEPEIIKKADFVAANSPYLTDLAKQYNKQSYYIGQGCNLDDFLQPISTAIPSDIIPIKGPKIGYVGLLTKRRLDDSIIKFIAISKPNWNIILVGPEEDDFKISKLHEFKNVHFLGPKNPEDLCFYIHSFDVCINPQVVNELTKGNYPRKIDEYLACGKPVVATYTPTMEVFKNHCYLAHTSSEYVQKIEQALVHNSPTLMENRKKFAADHSWENSIKSLWQAVEGVSA